MSGSCLTAYASGSIARTKSPAESGQPCVLLLCSVIGVANIPIGKPSSPGDLLDCYEEVAFFNFSLSERTIYILLFPFC